MSALGSTSNINSVIPSQSQSPCVSNTSPADWKYVAEGGATIVFAYLGPLLPSLTGTVLRLRKVKHGKLRNKDIEYGNAEGNQVGEHREQDEEPDDPSIHFQRYIISKLIPEQFRVDLRVVKLDQQWLAAFAQFHDGNPPGDDAETASSNIDVVREEVSESDEADAVGGVRPQWRRAVDGIDVTRRKGVLADNLVGGDGICTVEIKPKWSFLPSLTHLSPPTLPLKSHTCRTCMHNSLRQTQTPPQPAATRFCPLDLHSGDPDRVRKALEGLWDDWVDSEGRINNLRIFVDGKVVVPRPEGEEEEMDTGWARSLDAFYDTQERGKGVGGLDIVKRKRRFVGTLLPIVLTTPIFNILKKLQRELDPLDREGYVTLRERVLSDIEPCTNTATTHLENSHLSQRDSPLSLPTTQTSEPEPTLAEWETFVNTYLASHHMQNHRDPEVSVESLRYYTLAYMLSATFKDCSVVVRMKFPASVNTDEEGAVQVKVIDLDPKAVKKIKQWERLDEEIVRAYMRVPEERRKVCRDVIQ